MERLTAQNVQMCTMYRIHGKHSEDTVILGGQRSKSLIQRAKPSQTEWRNRIM
jgi:hypothetical protein